MLLEEHEHNMPLGGHRCAHSAFCISGEWRIVHLRGQAMRISPRTYLDREHVEGRRWFDAGTSREHMTQVILHSAKCGIYIGSTQGNLCHLFRVPIGVDVDSNLPLEWLLCLSINSKVFLMVPILLGNYLDFTQFDLCHCLAPVRFPPFYERTYSQENLVQRLVAFHQSQ